MSKTYRTLEEMCEDCHYCVGLHRKDICLTVWNFAHDARQAEIDEQKELTGRFKEKAIEKEKEIYTLQAEIDELRLELTRLTAKMDFETLEEFHKEWMDWLDEPKDSILRKEIDPEVHQLWKQIKLRSIGEPK